MTIKEKFVSVSQVRKDISSYIKNLKTSWEKIVFVNNKPKAVLLDFDKYEQLLNQKNNVTPLEWSEEVLWTKDHDDFISLIRWA